MPEGTVRWFDAERGFGFLALSDGAEDLFVHASEILGDGGARLLREGQAVEFEVGEGDRGPQARRVRVTGDTAPGAPLGVLGTVTWSEPGEATARRRTAAAPGSCARLRRRGRRGGLPGQRVAFLVARGSGACRPSTCCRSAPPPPAPLPAAPGRRTAPTAR